MKGLIRFLIWLVVIVGPVACVARNYRPSQPGTAPQSAPANQLKSVLSAPAWTMLPTDAPTSTPVPSATVDYLSTAMAAQATADEARRINAMATADA